MKYLNKRRVVGVMVLVDGVVIGSVVTDEERPAPNIAVILVARVQHITVEKQRVTCSACRHKLLTLGNMIACLLTKRNCDEHNRHQTV